jgi:hypothetical protein
LFAIEEGPLKSKAPFVLPSFLEVVKRNEILLAGEKSEQPQLRSQSLLEFVKQNGPDHLAWLFRQVMTFRCSGPNDR